MANEMNEKYTGYYMEVMTGTLTEAIVRNISLQANLKVIDEIVKDQNKTLESWDKEKKELKTSLEEIQKRNVVSESETIKILQNKINEQQNVIHKLSEERKNLLIFKSDNEKLKNQADHVETFKNELVKAREEIKSLQDNHVLIIGALKKQQEDVVKKLNEKIEYLQLTPAKRKKLDLAKAEEEKTKKVELPKVEVPKETANTKAKIIKQELPTLVLKDGGSF